MSFFFIKSILFITEFILCNLNIYIVIVFVYLDVFTKNSIEILKFTLRRRKEKKKDYTLLLITIFFITSHDNNQKIKEKKCRVFLLLKLYFFSF